MIKKRLPQPIVFGIIGIIIFAIVFLLIIGLGKNYPEANIVGDDVISELTIKYPNEGIKSQLKGEEAAREYLRQSGIVDKSYLDNSEIIRSIDDNEEAISEFDIKVPYNHYFFQQYINGTPIQDSILGVHLRNGNEVYYVSGKVVTRSDVEKESISVDEAANNALTEALKELGEEVTINPPIVEKVIYNGKLIGISNNNKNIPAVKVELRTDDIASPFAKEYFISLVDGEKLEERSLISYALNRALYDCTGVRTTLASCSIARTEGSGLYGNKDVDDGYNYIGNTYNFFFNTYQRDSYDGRGAQLKGYANTYTGEPNAYFDSSTGMVYTPGMVAADVTGHELTHGVTSLTAGLAYNAQSGAINEGMSDVFGWAVDQKDWTLGEDTVGGVVRSYSNPPAKGQPDRLFASNYWCSPADNYGVHINSGILNKTFYLLVQGGSFNTCNITSIGKDRALSIFYRTLTRYLTPSSNFKNLYESLLQACNDLYGSEAGVCEQVDIASQATEIDQQPVGVQAGPFCSGKQRQAPKCSGNPGGTVSTATPNPLSTPTPTPTASRFYISGRVFQDNNGDGVFNSGDLGLSNETINLSGSFTDTTTTLTDGVYIFDNLFEGTFKVSYNTISTGDISLALSAPAITGVDFIITKNPANPTPTIIIGPSGVPTPTPTTSIPTGSATRAPTPTPPTLYTCEYDPKCTTGQKNIQLCPLICTEKNDGRGGVAPSSSPTPISAATATPGGSSITVTPTPTPGDSGSIPTATTTPTTVTDNPVQQVVDLVSINNIESNLLSIIDDDEIAGQDQSQTRYTGLQGNVVEANYIQGKLSEYGVTASFQNFNVSGVSTRNIIGKIDGINKNDVYLVTAHMDSTAQTNSGTKDPAPGANDNGSGTVAVIEAARVLKSIQENLKDSLEFVLFSGEEQGLYGSYYYAQNIASGKNIKGVINLDMIGNKGGATCVNFYYKNYNGGDILSNKAVEMIKSYTINLDGASMASSNGQSDHKPFWDIGIPAIFVHECINNWTVYHSVNDKMDFINISQIANTTKAVSATIADLATK